MSLNKKILFGFFISASVFAGLVAFELFNFVEIKKQIRNLELTDTIRSKTLQLRRHEKNYFLYSPQKGVEESRAVHDYIRQISGIIQENIASDKTGRLEELRMNVDSYSAVFSKIESDVSGLKRAIARERETRGASAGYLQLVEITFLEQPSKGADFLVGAGFNRSDRLVEGLYVLEADIQAIRRHGEEIINLSKRLDGEARKSAEDIIFNSQVGMFIFFPIFLIAGMGTLYLTMRSIKSRLNLLMDAIEHTGRGPEPYKTVHGSGKEGGDEVDLLIKKFNDMEYSLAAREDELGRTSRELHQAKKLAAIGTLASGVAHELNNPLNNIYISAQVLSKEAGEDANPVIREVVGDIVGQTARVKRIVGDLLEFARGKEPAPKPVDIVSIVREIHRLLRTTSTYGMEGIGFRMEPEGPAVVFADPEQMERVFINLFTNSVEAMRGMDGGEIAVRFRQEGSNIHIEFSDNGPGIPQEDMEKIFEPFYTTKNKGTGLGLAIVFSIIQKNSGKIRAESKKGAGTVFYITLPKG